MIKAILKSVLFGTLIGGIYGLTLIVSLMSGFGTASFILYGNYRILPLATAIVVGFTAYIPLVTYRYWEQAAMDAIYRLSDDLYPNEQDVEIGEEDED